MLPRQWQCNGLHLCDILTVGSAWQARHAVEVLPAYLPSDGASRCACQLAAAEAKAGPGASRQCRCTASLAALLRDHGLRDPVGGILPGNLAAAVAAAGAMPPRDRTAPWRMSTASLHSVETVSDIWQSMRRSPTWITTVGRVGGQSIYCYIF